MASAPYRCAIFTNSASFTQVVPVNQYIPAIYELVQNWDQNYVTDTNETYFSAPPPYSTITVNQQASVMITGYVTWWQGSADRNLHLYVQLKRNGESFWNIIGGNSTGNFTTETATSWKSTNVAMAYRLFKGDQVRLAYYVEPQNDGATTSITIVPGIDATVGRTVPAFVVTTVPIPKE